MRSCSAACRSRTGGPSPSSAYDIVARDAVLAPETGTVMATAECALMELELGRADPEAGGLDALVG